MNPPIEPGTYPVHDFSHFVLRFWGDVGIRYYGLAYVLGFFIAGWLIYRAAKTQRAPLKPLETDLFLVYMVAGVMIGGRLGSILFYGIGRYLAEPWKVFYVWEGGMASHGGFIGVCGAVLLFAWRKQRSPLRLGDMVAMAAPPGIFLGRIANFINGELWGKVTTVSWAWIFPDAPSVYSAPGYREPLLGGQFVNPRHPSQLYEAGLEGLLMGAYVMWRYWGRKGPLPRGGQLVAEFLMGYALVRIFGEQFREPDADLVFGLSRGVALSILTFLIGLGLWFGVRRRSAGAGSGKH